MNINPLKVDLHSPNIILRICKTSRLIRSHFKFKSARGSQTLLMSKPKMKLINLKPPYKLIHPISRGRAILPSKTVKIASWTIALHWMKFLKKFASYQKNQLSRTEISQFFHETWSNHLLHVPLVITRLPKLIRSSLWSTSTHVKRGFRSHPYIRASLSCRRRITCNFAALTRVKCRKIISWFKALRGKFQIWIWKCRLISCFRKPSSRFLPLRCPCHCTQPPKNSSRWWPRRPARSQLHSWKDLIQRKRIHSPLMRKTKSLVEKAVNLWEEKFRPYQRSSGVGASVPCTSTGTARSA